MASENAQILEKFMGCYGTGDIETMKSLIHPEGVFHESAELPYGGDHVGPEGFAALLGEMLGAYEMGFTGAETWDAGEKCVCRIQATFTSRQSGRSVKLNVTEIYSFTDGKISDADVYYQEPGFVRDLHQTG